MVAREQVGREASPTAGIIDRQSVRTTEAGGPRGFDAGKKGEIALWAAARERLRLEIVRRPRDAAGFHLLPRRPPGPTGPGPFGIGAASAAG